jgi:hypothetical protein
MLFVLLLGLKLKKAPRRALLLNLITFYLTFINKTFVFLWS